MPEIYINDRSYPFKEGETILEVARRNNIYIPVMCYLKEITPTGACRLCLVEIEGVDKPAAACVTYALDGMKIYTDTEKVKKDRKRMLDFVLIKHPLDCPVCDKAGECMLQDTAYEFGINEESISSEKPDKPVFDWGFIINDTNLCVMCERCVKVCHEITGCSALKIEERGFNNIINTTTGDTLSCDFCGLCVDFCPVGALLDKPYKHSVRSWDLDKIKTFCTYCPVGCEIEADIHNNEIFRCRSTENSFICSLGRYAFKYPENENRIKSPMIKDGNSYITTDWNTAISKIEEKLKGIKQNYGDDSIAFVLGSRLDTETLMGYKKLADELGTNKILADIQFENDEIYKIHKSKFGTYDNVGVLGDIKESGLIFVIGSDLSSEALGIKWRVMNAVIHNSAKLVTIGAKKYEYDEFTDISLLADYGDYASIFEGIKSGDSEFSSDIREYIESSDKISFIVGNEFISSEAKPESVYAFLDYVGKDKLQSFFIVSDKTNITASLTSGITELGYTPAQLSKDISNSRVKAVIAVGFYPFNTYGNYKMLRKSVENTELFISVDMFVNDFNKKSDIILPALSALECEGSYLTLDGRVIRSSTVFTSDTESKTDVSILSSLASVLGVELPESNEEVWSKLVAGKNGIPAIDFYEIDGFITKDKDYDFNKTSFSYESRSEGTVEIFVNAKHHNNYLSTAAVVEKDVDGYLKKYYFDVEDTVVSGKDACFDGKCDLVDNIAKGTVLIPKNLK
jgi:NADH dehydrogenase/NADH:ubiquinone oxidoreductase subunit G